MALDLVRVSLRGYGGESPTGRTFFDLLGLGGECELSLHPSDLPWQAASVILLEVAMQDIQDSPEPFEEYAARLRDGFLRAAERLASLPSNGLVEWRAGGRRADIFISGWLDDQQFDLDLPAEFLLACGTLGLTLSICTND